LAFGFFAGIHGEGRIAGSATLFSTELFARAFKILGKSRN
jgi:hypothetical protein